MKELIKKCHKRHGEKKMDLFVVGGAVLLLVIFYAGFLTGRSAEKNKIYPGVYKNLGIIPVGENKTVVATKSEWGGIETYIIKDKVPPEGFFRVTEEGVYVGIEKNKCKEMGYE